MPSLATKFGVCAWQFCDLDFCESGYRAAQGWARSLTWFLVMQYRDWVEPSIFPCAFRLQTRQNREYRFNANSDIHGLTEIRSAS